MTGIPTVPLTRHLGGFCLHGQPLGQSASDAASTSVEGLRQPGGDHATLNQNVPDSIQVPIVADATLRAGPGPDRQGFLP